MSYKMSGGGGDRRGENLHHDAVKLFYDDEYHCAASPTGHLAWHQRLIAARLGDLQGKSVLDIACGTGEWLAEMQRRGARISGVDISGKAIQACRTRLPGVDAREGVAETLPFEHDSFDLVTCLGALEHFLDQPGALREMVRVAKSGGTILILVPNAGFLTRRLGLYRGTAQAAIRETVRPIKEWEAMLRDAGLVVSASWRDLHTCNWRWITGGSVWSWPARMLQAGLLLIWPLGWQYQVYFLCRPAQISETAALPDTRE
jgi:ubiquinone/menaquinone biosynthesis C-methylase UbiE